MLMWESSRKSIQLSCQGFILSSWVHLLSSCSKMHSQALTSQWFSWMQASQGLWSCQSFHHWMLSCWKCLECSVCSTTDGWSQERRKEDRLADYPLLVPYFCGLAIVPSLLSLLGEHDSTGPWIVCPDVTGFCFSGHPEDGGLFSLVIEMY